MSENDTGNIIWSTLGFSIERLNISNDTHVHKDYVKSMDYIGYFDFNIIFKEFFSDDELSSILWHLHLNKIHHINRVHLYKTDIFHKLRFSENSGAHYECWIFGMIPCKDNLWRLCPLKRTSDFDFDVIKRLENMMNK
jgi:hypothetical protein